MSKGIFHFFKIFIFQVVIGVKGQKIAQNDEILSATLHISGTIYHMMVIYGTHVQNDNIPYNFSHFFKILIFQVVRRVEGHTSYNQ